MDIKMKQFKLLIGGKLVDGASTMPVINPASGESFQDAPRANEAQLNAAVKAAKSAFPSWSATSVDERKQRLRSLAEKIQEKLSEMAAVLTSEQGKPLAQAQGEIFGAAYFIGAFVAMDLPPKVLREDASSKVVEYRVPLGVVAAITPWNYPLLLLIQKMAPALLAGNTLVIKPAPTTPLTTLLLGELCAEVFPAGVVNIITDDNDLGAVLTSHPDVAKVSFTGSTGTGKKVLGSVASSLKRVTLELGGNDAALLLDDVDVKGVAAQIYNVATYNAGQTCIAVKRIYVPDSLYDSFCEELAHLASDSVVGDGFDPATQIGPLQNKAQFEKVKQLLIDTQASGRVIAGGKPLDRPGYFIPPTVVRDVADDAAIVAEEQFSPILPVLRYSDVNDAISRINNSEFGLGGSVWGKDLERAEQVARRIDSGTVWVNSHMRLDPTIPFGGAKQSGAGVELGQEGLNEYTQMKIVNVLKG
jgi:acyl-CoA reductase-like NAD-dependent aldehyde dehydrogenase